MGTARIVEFARDLVSHETTVALCHVLGRTAEDDEGGRIRPGLRDVVEPRGTTSTRRWRLSFEHTLEESVEFSGSDALAHALLPRLWRRASAGSPHARCEALRATIGVSWLKCRLSLAFCLCSSSSTGLKRSALFKPTIAARPRSLARPRSRASSWSEMPLRHVAEQDDHLGASDGADRPDHAFCLDSALDARPAANACGVDDAEAVAAEFDDPIDGIARSARSAVDERAFVARESIEERRFSGVRPSDQRDIEQLVVRVTLLGRTLLSAGVRRSRSRLAEVSTVRPRRR